MKETPSGAARMPLTGQGVPDRSALIPVIRRLTVCRSHQEVIETVTPAARRLLAADGITFVLSEGDFCRYADEDAISPLWKGKRFPKTACISGWCMIERRSATIEDIYRDPRIPHDAYRPTFVKSLAMVPVQQDDPIAALGAYWRERRTIAPAELELLQAVANMAGLAIGNIDLRAQRETAAKTRHELSHRISNLLSVVTVLARQTLRSTTDPKAFGAVFCGRLQALAQAQTVLNGPGEDGASIRTLVQEQVLLGGEDARVTCSGPEVPLGADEALDLALALHELGTNARKYGALSNDHGRVVITWREKATDDTAVVNLTWTEQNGPRVEPPSEHGFGSTLLRHAFRRNGGGVQLDFRKNGIVCEMTIPLLWCPRQR